jgi:2'-5' RNA ligase
VARAFVAVTLPAPVLDSVEAATAGVEFPDARRTPRDQWHITLQFLGNHVDLDATAAALGTLAAGGGVVQLGGAGAFPKPARASVLWIGVSRGVEFLTELAFAVAGVTGVALDDRPYRPHLTVARTKHPTDLRGAVDRLGDASFGPPWDVRSITLFESQNAAAGARHVSRVEVALEPA